MNALVYVVLSRAINYLDFRDCWVVVLLYISDKIILYIHLYMAQFTYL